GSVDADPVFCVLSLDVLINARTANGGTHVTVVHSHQAMLNTFRCDGGGVIGQVKFLNGEDLGTLFRSIARERATAGPLPNRIRRGTLRIPCKGAARIDVSCHDKGGAGVGPGGATEIDRVSVYEDIELEVLRALDIRRADRKRRNCDADDCPESRKTPHALLHDCSHFYFVILHDLIFLLLFYPFFESSF